MSADLNWKEQRVYDALVERRHAFIRTLAVVCFPGVRPVQKADSQVRNALRRLVDHGLVARLGRGHVELAPLDGAA